MRRHDCQREVKSGKCSQGVHCTSEEAIQKKPAANSACKAELAARKATR